MAKFLLKILGYRDLLNHSQRDIMAALRIWMMEDTYQVVHIRFLPLSPTFFSISA